MKMLEIEYVTEEKVDMHFFIQMIHKIHNQVNWEILSESHLLLGYTKEDAWLYEYVFDYQSLNNIRFTVSKLDHANPITQCNLTFLDAMESIEFCVIDDLDLFKLMGLKDELDDKIVSFYQQWEVNSQLKIPILMAPSFNQFYEYEVNDMLMDMIESRIQTLKKINQPSLEEQLLEEILSYNPYKGERRDLLVNVYEALLMHNNLDLLKYSGIHVEGNQNNFFMFFDNPKYIYVAQRDKDKIELYKELKRKFF